MLETICIGALIVTSVVAVAFIIERGLALRWQKVIPRPVETALEQYNSPNDLPLLRQTCEDYPSTFSRLLSVVADHLHWPKVENVGVLETRARHEVLKLERGLVVLEIIVGIAPLLGLTGTIYGLIILFGGMGQAGANDSAKFAQGISLALNATLMGLLIAIPALIFWSYYTKKVETLAVEMETLCDEFMRRHYRKPDEPLPASVSRKQRKR